MKLCVIIPVFNEERTLVQILNRVKEVDVEKEIIIVNDGSSDFTQKILKDILDQSIKIIHHSKNQGKGSCIRTALPHVCADAVIIQDADLEYNPQDYKRLIEPLMNKKYDVVYGSRFLSKRRSDSLFHYLVNWFLTFLVNILFHAKLTDMETCYKLFRTHIIKGLDLKSNGFEIEPELTIKTLRKGYKIFEVPISYQPRSYKENKKITWKDGIKTLWIILQYRFKRLSHALPQRT